MKIALLGSICFAEKFVETASLLETKGHTATVPADTEQMIQQPERSGDLQKDLDQAIAKGQLRKAFDAIAASDAVVVLNYPNNGVDGYIGTSTLMELALAFYLHKPIFLLHPTPDCKEHRWAQEVAMLQPQVLNGDINGVPPVMYG